MSDTPKPRCGDCKHARPTYGGEAPPFEVPPEMLHCIGVREKWMIEDDVREAASKLATTELRLKAYKNAVRNAGAYVEDGSTYYAALIVMPDFFCAKFQPKGGDDVKGD